MNERAEQLATRVLEHPGVYDPPTIHHEFKDGGHGRKLDMESIKPNSQLFDDLVMASAQRMRAIHKRIPEVIIGIANGGIPWASAVAEELGTKTVETEKDRRRRAVLPYAARRVMRQIKPDEVMIIDDLGTTGSSCLPVINQLQANLMRSRHPVRNVSVFYVAQRQLTLPKLDKLDVAHDSLLLFDLMTYKDAAECHTDPEGYCARGVELIMPGG